MTNSLNYLLFVDNIIFINNGQISDSGSYEDLMAKKGPLWNFIKTNKTNEGEKESNKKFAFIML